MASDGLECQHRIRKTIDGRELFEWCGRGAEQTEVGPRCLRHAPPAPRGDQHPQRTRAIIECDKLTLSREERHELAEMLTGHAGTWSNIDEGHARRIADAASGFLPIQALLLMRRHPA